VAGGEVKFGLQEVASFLAGGQLPGSLQAAVRDTQGTVGPQIQQLSPPLSQHLPTKNGFQDGGLNSNQQLNFRQLYGGVYQQGLQYPGQEYQWYAAPYQTQQALAYGSLIPPYQAQQASAFSSLAHPSYTPHVLAFIMGRSATTRT
jgi:hypothetical protein